MSKVKIVGKAPFGTEIYVDGKKVGGISSYSISQNAGEMPELKLSIPATEIDIETPCIPELPEYLKKYYKGK